MQQGVQKDTAGHKGIVLLLLMMRDPWEPHWSSGTLLLLYIPSHSCTIRCFGNLKRRIYAYNTIIVIIRYNTMKMMGS
jgi:hypothetical protein